MADNAYALQMLNSCPGLLCFAVDRDGLLLYATRGYREIARRLLGHECAEGQPYPPNFDTQFSLDLRDMIQEAFMGETAAANLRENDGNRNEWLVTCAPLANEGAIVSLTPDNSDFFDSLDSLPGMFFAADEAGRCVSANASFLDAVKQPKDAVLGRPFTELLIDDAADFAEAIAGKSFDNLECAVSCGNGSVVWLSLSGRYLQGQTLINCADITRMRRAEEQLKRASTTDTSTGLLNRNGMERLLGAEAERAARYGSPLSMLILDIDGFRKLNEQLGYEASDAVLRELAAAIKLRVGLTDFLGRWGGDEFMILTPTPLAAAVQLAENLRAAAERVPAGQSRLTLSAGVAEFSSDISAFVGAAFDAMLDAKKAGGNKVEPR